MSEQGVGGKVEAMREASLAVVREPKPCDPLLKLKMLESAGLAMEPDHSLRRRGALYGEYSPSSRSLLMAAPLGGAPPEVPVGDVEAVEFDGSGTMAVWTDFSRWAYAPLAESGADYSGSKAIEVDELADSLLPAWFPGLRRMAWTDELAERMMVDPRLIGRPLPAGVEPGPDGSVPSEAGVPLSDAVYIEFRYEVFRRRRLNGERRRIGRRDVDDALYRVCASTRRNAFREWLESLEAWDGEPRVDTWLASLFGGTARPLGPAEEARYLAAVGRAWLVGAVARQYGTAKHEVVPVFIGPQGLGKGSALRYTAGEDRWYRDTSADVQHPDRLLDNIRGGVIVELSEATQLRADRAEELKSFISRESDRYRKPYARTEEEYPRHFVLAATTNYNQVLSDITGNRRFYPVYCDASRATRRFSLNRASRSQHEVRQMWAEALALYRAGEPWHLSADDMALAMRMQARAAQEDAGVAEVDGFLDDPANGYSRVGVKVSAKILCSELYGIPEGEDTSANPAMREVRGAIRRWSRSTRCWDRLENVTLDARGNKTRCWVRRVEPGGAPVVAESILMTDDDIGPEEEMVRDASAVRAGAEEAFRSFARENGLSSGDAFDPDAFAAEDGGALEALLDACLVYEAGWRDGRMTYRVVRARGRTT